MRTFAHFGYGYFDSKYEAVPNVPVVYYSFRAMVTLGGAFILLFALLSWFAYRPAGTDIDKRKWLMWFALLMAPMAWVASQTGWVVAEMGRQPWTIQNLLPVRAAVSQLEASSVIVTFCSLCRALHCYACSRTQYHEEGYLFWS